MTGRRARQVALLVWPIVRLLPWMPVAVAAVLGFLGLLPALLGAPAPAAPIWALRIAAVLLGAAASLALLDPMALLSVTPTPRWLRQWLRLFVALLPPVAVWLGFFVLIQQALPPARADLPLRELATEAAVCCLTGFAGAAVAARAAGSAESAGAARLAGPATQGAMIVGTFFLADRHSPWVLPSAETWAAAQRHWAWALPILVLTLACANRDTWPVCRKLALHPKWIRL